MCKQRAHTKQLEALYEPHAWRIRTLQQIHKDARPRNHSDIETWSSSECLKNKKPICGIERNRDEQWLKEIYELCMRSVHHLTGRVEARVLQPAQRTLGRVVSS